MNRSRKPYQPFISLLLYSIVLMILLGACIRRVPINYEESVDEQIEITSNEAIVRDFQSIKDEGVIRLLTRYNSNSYFLQKGIPRGFEYELVEAFAKENDLALEVIILRAQDDPYDMLNRGEGDIYAANLSINNQRTQKIGFSNPYNIVNQVLALYKDYNVSNTINGLGPITISVRKNTSYYQTLQNYKNAGASFNIEVVPENWDTEGLLQAVARGEIMSTVADENILMAAKTYLPDLDTGPIVAEQDSIAWGIRKNAPLLKARMDRFLSRHFRISSKTGKPIRSSFLNVLSKKYYTDGSEVAKNIRPVRNVLQKGQLSVYDDIIKDLSENHGVDWKLVASLIAQESRFDPYAESWVGARGLMQIMPHIVDSDSLDLFDPYINVNEGINILKQHLNHYKYLDQENQWAMALATYNAGMGHIADARRIVIDRNKNPNEWEHVSDALLKLMRYQYYQHARYGFCRGIETVNYVNEVLSRYTTYSAILAMSSGSLIEPSANATSGIFDEP